MKFYHPGFYQPLPPDLEPCIPSGADLSVPGLRSGAVVRPEQGGGKNLVSHFLFLILMEMSGFTGIFVQGVEPRGVTSFTAQSVLQPHEKVLQFR